jgi:hypothetical protein
LWPLPEKIKEGCTVSDILVFMLLLTRFPKKKKNDSSRERSERIL